jgi:hypothetical protein
VLEPGDDGEVDFDDFQGGIMEDIGRLRIDRRPLYRPFKQRRTAAEARKTGATTKELSLAWKARNKLRTRKTRPETNRSVPEKAKTKCKTEKIYK